MNYFSDRKYLLFILTVLTVCSAQCVSAQNQLTSGLESGEWAVGFKVFHEYDQRRSYFPKYDYFGKRTGFPMGRPLQIAVWYPAKDKHPGNEFSYGDYIRFTASEIDFANDSKSARQSMVDEIVDRVAPAFHPQINRLLNQHVCVKLNADQAIGDFPLVIYAPPMNTSWFDNSVLCEYLASKGYVVLATTAKGEYTRMQGQGSRSIHVQADDIAYLAQFGRRFTNNEKIATIGFSRGGLANLIFAMKNKNVDATISLDGSIFSAGWLADIKASEYYEPAEFDSNLLMITKNLSAPQLNPATFYDQVQFCDKCLIRFDHGNHGYFSAHTLLLDLTIRDSIPEEQKKQFATFYVEMAEYVGSFLDHYVKEEQAFSEHQDKRFKHSFDFKTSTQKAIDPASIAFWINHRGIDYVNKIVAAIETTDSDFTKKLNWRDLNPIADQLANDGKHAEAVKVLLLSDKAFPDWYITNKQIADCYLQLDQQQNGIEHLRIALADNPRDSQVRDSLIRLGIQPPDYRNVRIEQEELSKYVGKYWMDEDRFKQIYVENDQLFMSANYWDQPMKIWPYKKDLFLVEGNDRRSNLQLLFQFNESGQVISLKTRGMNSGRVSEANQKE